MVSITDYIIQIHTTIRDHGNAVIMHSRIQEIFALAYIECYRHLGYYFSIRFAVPSSPESISVEVLICNDWNASQIKMSKMKSYKFLLGGIYLFRFEFQPICDQP